MPTVLYVKGYRFYFYAGDGAEPAHVHVEKGGGNGKVWPEPELNPQFYILEPKSKGKFYRSSKSILRS